MPGAHNRGPERPAPTGVQYELLMLGPPLDERRRADGGILGGFPGGVSQDPDARGVDKAHMVTLGGMTNRCAEQHVDRLAVDVRAPFRRLVCSVNDRVARFGGLRVCRGPGKVAHDRLHATQRNPLRFFRIANEGGHVMRTAEQSIEHRRTDVACGARQEDPHRERIVVGLGSATCAYLAGTAE